MSYTRLALSAIDSGAYCPLLTGAPTASSTRADWARMRDQWGCPQRLGAFWFFSGAPSIQWYGGASALIRNLVPSGSLPLWSPGSDPAVRTMAFAEWQSQHPADWWCPPFLLDYATPVDPYEVPPAPHSDEPALPNAPLTTIPCFCWSSPGFKEAHARAYAQVQKECNYQSACMQKASTINLINYRALEQGASLCNEKYNPCCAATAGQKSCPNSGGATAPAPANPNRTVTTVVGLSALALAGYLVWRKRQQAR